MEISVDFENEVLSRCLRDSTYLKKATNVVEAHHFSTKQHSWVWDKLKGIWDKYRETCSPKMLLVKAKRDFPDDEKRVPYIELIRKLFKLKLKHSAAALDELGYFVRAVNAQLMLERSATFLEKGKIDEAYEVARTMSQRDLRPRTYTRIKWIEEFEERQAEAKHRKEHPEDYISIPTGIKKLDAIITGLQVGEVGLVLGTTGRGKSVMLNNIAYASVKYGFETAYFAFEMPAIQVARRQDARWLGMLYKKFKDYDFSPSELREIQARLKKIRPRWKDKFQIFSLPVRSATINTVRSALDDARMETGFKPKLVIFDSADHLLPTGRSENIRVDQANVYWAMKGMAEEDGYACWSSTQAGKEYATRVATAEASSESYDKGRIADLMISLNEPSKHSRATTVVDDVDEDVEEEEEMAPSTVGRYMEMYLAKYRDGASRISVPLDADFARMLITEAGE